MGIDVATDPLMNKQPQPFQQSEGLQEQFIDFYLFSVE